jgi:hypothetical protein
MSFGRVAGLFWCRTTSYDTSPARDTTEDTHDDDTE